MNMYVLRQREAFADGNEWLLGEWLKDIDKSRFVYK